jgi:hypothetical protein
VRALPEGLPEQIGVDVTKLGNRQSIHSRDYSPARCGNFGEKGRGLLSRRPGDGSEETAATEAAATPGEVEMIKEKKEEGAEGARPKGRRATRLLPPKQPLRPSCGAGRRREKK